jgi:uncharacterized protein (DUF779 family)
VSGAADRISATPAAREAIDGLRARLGGSVMFVQSGGCCDGSAPQCYAEGEFLIGANDVLLGEVDGCPFYIDASLDTAWGHPSFVLDVAAGPAGGLSLAAGPDQHFVTKPTEHLDRCRSE